MGDNLTKPDTIAVSPEAIPADLKALDRWVVTRLTPTGKPSKPWDKPPLQVNGRAASSTNPRTWTTFDKALAAYEDGRFDGIGFVLTDDDDLAGIDLDNCVNDGTVEPWAQEVIDRIGSYTEISLSGTGVHILTRGKLPPGGRKTGDPHKVEMYDTGRYLTVTGHRLTDSGIEHRQDELEHEHARWFPPVPNGTPDEVGTGTHLPDPRLSDFEIIDLARNAANGSKFLDYYNGSNDGTDDGTDSAGDLAMLCQLAFYTRDRDQLDRLFRGSPRMRDKWNRADYRDRTIDKALESVTETYTPAGFNVVPVRLPDGTIRWEGGSSTEPNRDATEPPPPNYGRHDTGNAQLLAELHRGRIRHIAPWKSWLTWDGTRWQRDLEDVHLTELAKDVGRELIVRAATIGDDDARKKALQWATLTLGAGRIQSMIKLARGIDGIPLDHELLDTDPWLLGVRNGVVDLRTGQLRDADPADLMTMQCPVEWDADAAAPQWEAALRDWFPDPATRAYFHRLVGQALVGLQRDHVFVIHYGHGANGKGTAARALQHVLGPYTATPDLALLTETKWGAHDTATAALFRARLAIASETERRVRLAEASIKNLTGGDRISARRLYENPWAFTPTHSLWLMTNYLPQITGRDTGIWRRIRVVPWVATFANGNGDRTLDDKLRAEAAGILRWAVQGVAEWLQHGLDEPDQVVKATAAYRSAEDVLGRFATDTGIEFAPDLTIGKTEISDLYTQWADAEGITLPKTALRDWLADENGCADAISSWKTAEGKRKQARIWKGVGIPEKGRVTAETQAQQGNPPDSVTTVTHLPETFSKERLTRKVTEGLSQPSQPPEDEATQPPEDPIFSVCDQPGDLTTERGAAFHDTPRCRPFPKPEEPTTERIAEI